MPMLYSKNGEAFRTENVSEIVRLRASGYRDTPGPVKTFDDTRFHPEGQGVQEVIEYMAQNPGDRDRVIAEEKAGKARTTIVNFDAPKGSE